MRSQMPFPKHLWMVGTICRSVTISALIASIPIVLLYVYMRGNPLVAESRVVMYIAVAVHLTIGAGAFVAGLLASHRNVRDAHRYGYELMPSSYALAASISYLLLAGLLLFRHAALVPALFAADCSLVWLSYMVAHRWVR